MKRHLLLSASLFHAINDGATVTIPMIFPILYSQKYIITRYSHIGLISYLGLLVTLVCQTLIAHNDTRYQYKHLVLFSLAGIIATLAVLPAASNMVQLFAIYLLFRFFTSFYHPVGISWVSKTYSGAKLDFAMGIQTGSGDFGVLIAFVATGYLAQRFGWRTPLLCFAAAALLLGAAAVFTAARTSTRQVRSMTRLSCWKETYGQVRFFVPGLLFGGACWVTTIYYAPSLLHHRFGIPMGATGMSLALWIGAGTAITYLFGPLSRKAGRHNILLAGLGGSTLSLLFLGSATNPLAATISLFFFGSFLFLIYPAIQTYVGQEVSEKNQTVAFSIVANVQMLAGSIAGLISGLVSDFLGIKSPFLFLSLCGLAVTAYYFWMYRTLVSRAASVKPSND
jgi:MFS family permease